MKATEKTTKPMALAECSTTMETPFKHHGTMTNQSDLAFIFTETAPNIQVNERSLKKKILYLNLENFKSALDMGKDFLNGMMVRFMKENLLMTKWRGMELICFKIRKCITVYGKIT